VELGDRALKGVPGEDLAPLGLRATLERRMSPLGDPLLVRNDHMVDVLNEEPMLKSDLRIVSPSELLFLSITDLLCSLIPSSCK
jgi:hypothetical protein